MIIPGRPISITEADILKHITEEQIAHMYVDNFRQIGKPFISSLRIDRKESSCRIFMDRTGRLKYKDFADTRIRTQISLFEYVAYKYNESLEDALERIARDFNIQPSERDFTNSCCIFETQEQEQSNVCSSPLVIKIKKRDWTQADINYWSQYYIPIEMLERNNVKSISNLWFYKEGKVIYKTEFAQSMPVFSYEYYWHEGVFRRKIYKPLVKEYKWVSNTDYTVVQNYPNIPKEGELLFIQSSFKDCMVMERLGYYAVAPNSENAWLPDEYWKKLLQRWKNIIIFGNNDWNKDNNPGLAYAQTHSKRYGVPYIVNPYGEPSDISDFVKKYNLDEGKRLVEKLIGGV